MARARSEGPRDRNELGGSLGGRSAGAGEGVRRRAKEGARDERERVRRGRMIAEEPQTRAAARRSGDDELPRAPARSTKNRAAAGGVGAGSGLPPGGTKPRSGRAAAAALGTQEAGKARTRRKKPVSGAAAGLSRETKPQGGRYGGVKSLGASKRPTKA